MAEPEASAGLAPAGDAHRALAEDIQAFVRDLRHKRQAAPPAPYHDAARRVGGA